ncbi:hypothetical protein ANN_09379 [Periplaneta americana]|uniref:Uncharacterized protein n=1 Tax=Periplaneta americana TaxID=6978 RepID=A0ABQ8TL66_PERAM|nr:hypothetical protein ANN_09379 [Periplaneta americana]
METERKMKTGKRKLELRMRKGNAGKRKVETEQKKGKKANNIVNTTIKKKQRNGKWEKTAVFCVCHMHMGPVSAQNHDEFGLLESLFIKKEVLDKTENHVEMVKIDFKAKENLVYTKVIFTGFETSDILKENKMLVKCLARVFKDNIRLTLVSGLHIALICPIYLQKKDGLEIDTPHFSSGNPTQEGQQEDERSTEEEVEDFYRKLDNTLNEHRSNINFVIGTSTVRLEKRKDASESQVGSYGLGERNQRGDKLIEFAQGQRSTEEEVEDFYRKLDDTLNEHRSNINFVIGDFNIKVAGYTAKNKKEILYPNIPSAIRAVPHGPDIPVPLPPESDTLPSASSSTETESPVDHTYEPDNTGDDRCFNQILLFPVSVLLFPVTDYLFPVSVLLFPSQTNSSRLHYLFPVSSYSSPHDYLFPVSVLSSPSQTTFSVFVLLLPSQTTSSPSPSCSSPSLTTSSVSVLLFSVTDYLFPVSVLLFPSQTTSSPSVLLFPVTDYLFPVSVLLIPSPTTSSPSTLPLPRLRLALPRHDYLFLFSVLLFPSPSCSSPSPTTSSRLVLRFPVSDTSSPSPSCSSRHDYLFLVSVLLFPVTDYLFPSPSCSSRHRLPLPSPSCSSRHRLPLPVSVLLFPV